MDCFLRRLRALFQLKSRRSKSDLDLNTVPLCLNPLLTVAGAQGVDIEAQKPNIRQLQFLHNHAQHCVKNKMHQSNTISSDDQFTLFPLLPPEIRSKVWESVASQSHTVELSCTREYPRGKWFSHSKPPAIFQVCAESRIVALRIFATLAFPMGGTALSPPPQPIYINFSCTRLWLCADLFEEYARRLLESNEQLKTHLRHLVVNEELWKRLNPSATDMSYDLPLRMGKLQMSSRVLENLKALEDAEYHS